MQTNQRTLDNEVVRASATKQVANATMRRRAYRRYVFVLASLGLGVISGWKTFVVAEHPEPINRLGRILGQGYSDGYHACQSTGTRLLADLPAKSYTHRGAATPSPSAKRFHQRADSFATYYDHFDGACDAPLVQHQPPRLPQVMPETVPHETVIPESMTAAPIIDGSVATQPQPSMTMTPNRLNLPSGLNYGATFDPAAEAQRELEERARELEEQRKMLAEQERYRQFQVFEKLRQNNFESDIDDSEPADDSEPIEPADDLESIEPADDSEPANESTPIEASKPSEIDSEKKEDSLAPSSSDLQDLSSFGGPRLHRNPYAAPSSPSSTAVLPELQVPMDQSPHAQSSTTQSGNGTTTAVADPVQPQPMSGEQTQTRTGQSPSTLQPAKEDSIEPSEEPEKRIASREWLIIRQPK
jgi:hypothetical protein